MTANKLAVLSGIAQMIERVIQMPKRIIEKLRGRSRSVTLYKVLRDHLRQSETGQQVISAFEEDPGKEEAALAEYLREQLPQDEVLAKQLANALGTNEAQFTTLVTGGRVDKIVNVARVGVLNVRRYFYVFSDVYQVIAFFTIVILIGATITYGIWRAGQPDVMTGDFNIAVAEFVEIRLNDTADQSDDNKVARALSQRIFSLLDGQYLSKDIKVQVVHDKIGVIADAKQAKDLAEAIHADLVIYGDVTVKNGQAKFKPKFYVSNTYRTGTGEVNGEHRLAASITFNEEELVSLPSSGDLDLMQRRTAILIEFTKALVYLGSDKLGSAELAITQAIAASEEYGDFAGKEVLYLFASQIARLQPDNLDAAQKYVDAALALNEDYGRALIAQANIYYDLSDLNRARDFYEQALSAEEQPFDFVKEKASLGLGNIYAVQYQEINLDPKVGEADKVRYANEAIKSYQFVINAYLQQPDNDLLKDIAALAYYGAGIIYQTSGQCASAQQALKQAQSLMSEASLIISNKEGLITDIDRRLEELKVCES